MWQWLYAGGWIDCEPENQKLLDVDERSPSMDRMYMVNRVGELWGCPSSNDMTFRVHGDDEEIRTKIRRGPEPNELPLYCILTRGHQRYLPYETCRVLFDESGEEPQPRQNCCKVIVGTETFIAKNGSLYQEINGKLRKRRWALSKMSRWEAKKHCSTGFVWEFRGRFRWERTVDAVNTLVKNPQKFGFGVGEHLSEWREHLSDWLLALLRNFDPSADATEYGPYQFTDFLDGLADDLDGFADAGDLSSESEYRRQNLRKVANCLRDIHSTNNTDTWTPFDPFTNASIERDRAEGRPLSLFQSGDHVYALLFDSGAGASGAPPVVLRPGRYERFLTSIEEQAARRSFGQLFELLGENSIDPPTFLMATVTRNSYEEVVNEMCPEPIRERVNDIMESLNHRSSLSAMIQNFLPSLLDKFNECEIRMRSNGTASTILLDPSVRETIRSGLSSHTHDFKDLIKFIHDTKSWNLPDGAMATPGLKCDICFGDDSPVLGGHCGSHCACLQCWVECLANKDMECPFCRQEVQEGVLSLPRKNEKSNTAVSNPQGTKRKREQGFSSMDEILRQIHQVKMYKDVAANTRKTMRKWLTIFLRTSLIKLGRRNSPSINESEPKTLSAAVRDFRLLTQ